MTATLNAITAKDVNHGTDHKNVLKHDRNKFHVRKKLAIISKFTFNLTYTFQIHWLYRAKKITQLLDNQEKNVSMATQIHVVINFSSKSIVFN